MSTEYSCPKQVVDLYKSTGPGELAMLRTNHKFYMHYSVDREC